MLKKLFSEEKINELKELFGDGEVSLRPLSEYEREDVGWLWENRIPFGAVTLLEGEGGVGKSTVILNIIAKLTQGHPLPSSEVGEEPMNILLAACEDSPSAVIRPRCEAQGADISRISFIEGPLTLNLEGIAFLREAIIKNNIRLVAIDPIVAYLGPKVDMNKASDVRSVMAALAKIARELNCAIVLIRHFNKSQLGQAAHRGAGSVDFRNAARSVLQVLRDSESGKSYLTHEKSNLGPRTKTKVFAISQGVLNWGEDVMLTAEELHTSNNGALPSVLQTACEFLKQYLKDEAKPSKDLEEAAQERGISKKTLYRAKDRLGIRAYREDNRWMLAKYDQDGQDGQPQ